MICLAVSSGCLCNSRLRNHIIIQFNELFATNVATLAPFCTPFAVDSYFLPILSPDVPGNVIFDVFNSWVGNSIGSEEVYKPHTSTCTVSGCREDWAPDIMTLFI